MSKEAPDFCYPPPPKNYKISSAFSYNFKLALTVVARPEIDTGALIERLRNDLPAGCKLTAIWSIDHKRPIYFPRSTLVELFAEAGKRAPEATEAAMEVFGMKLLTLEEIRAENK